MTSPVSTSSLPGTIAFQGIKGSFSYLASLRYFPTATSFHGTLRFEEIFQSIQSGRASHGVIPIENSIAGSIHENSDLLAKYRPRVVGEVYLRVEHCLLVWPTGDRSSHRLQQIKKVISHPKALEQCMGFLNTLSECEVVAGSDTARAAVEVAGKKDPTLAAIASREAAAQYGIEVLVENIEDSSSNTTRFLILEPSNSPHQILGEKSSFLFTLPHTPGALAKTLSSIAQLGANVTKIESRPNADAPFHYRFYIDVVSKQGQREQLEQALRETTHDLIGFGWYKVGEQP